MQIVRWKNKHRKQLAYKVLVKKLHEARTVQLMSGEIAIILDEDLIRLLKKVYEKDD